ncbi:MAG: hypothetical protein ACO3FN_12930, partial [Vulcanococcus sp.]
AAADFAQIGFEALLAGSAARTFWGGGRGSERQTGFAKAGSQLRFCAPVGPLLVATATGLEWYSVATAALLKPLIGRFLKPERPFFPERSVALLPRMRLLV